MMPITEEQLAAAVKQFAMTKQIVDQAEAAKAAARQVILDYHKQDPNAFRLDPQSEKGNTWLISRGPHTIAVTFPESTPVPAHVDASKVEKLRDVLMDTIGDDATSYFDVQYTFREERFMQDVKDMKDVKAKQARLLALEPFIVPEVAGKPQSPRVMDKTGAK